MAAGCIVTRSRQPKWRMSMDRIDRRGFLRSAGGLTIGLPPEAAQRTGAGREGKAPFRVIFSNDATNIITCTSPYHKKGQPIPYHGTGAPLTTSRFVSSRRELPRCSLRESGPGP